MKNEKMKMNLIMENICIRWMLWVCLEKERKKKLKIEMYKNDQVHFIVLTAIMWKYFFWWTGIFELNLPLWKKKNSSIL